MGAEPQGGVEDLLTWCNHNFVFLGANSEEGEVVLGVDLTHGAPGLQDEVVHEAGVLRGGGIVHGAPDGDACGESRQRWGRMLGRFPAQRPLALP